MKRAILYFLLFLVCLQSSMQLVIFVGFKFYQKEIAQTLCVNKARPEMLCQGKCYLKKQLAKSKVLQIMVKWWENAQTVYLPTLTLKSTWIVCSEWKKFMKFSFGSSLEGYPFSIFRPPLVRLVSFA